MRESSRNLVRLDMARCALCRYVTPGGFRESALVAGLSQDALNSMESKVRARMRLYRPGGQMACELAKNPTVLIVNDSVFAHGGVLAQHGELAHGLHYASSSHKHCCCHPYLPMAHCSCDLLSERRTCSSSHMLLTVALIPAFVGAFGGMPKGKTMFDLTVHLCIEELSLSRCDSPQSQKCWQHLKHEATKRVTRMGSV